MKTNDEIVNQEIDDWLEPLAVTIETDDGEFLAVDIDLIKVPLRAMKDKWEREARADELKGIHISETNVIGKEFNKVVRDRIAELTQESK